MFPNFTMPFNMFFSFCEVRYLVLCQKRDQLFQAISTTCFIVSLLSIKSEVLTNSLHSPLKIFDIPSTTKTGILGKP
jgi:hypothetical protein